MKESMGQIIRKLRKEKNLTQEELAEQLGVTFQAVSKWENDLGMPDISQVVPLCNVLSVSSDVLFGICGEDDTKEINDFIRKIEKQVCNPTEGVSDYENDLACTQEVLEKLKQHPTNYKLLTYSMGHIVCLLDYFNDEDIEIEDREEQKRYWQNECIRQGNVVLRYCTDVEHLNSANHWLVSLYAKMGQLDKAEEYAKRLPTDFVYRNGTHALAWIYRDSGRYDDACKMYSRNVYSGLQLLQGELLPLAHLYYNLGRYEEAYACYKLFPDIYYLIVGEREDEIPFCHDLDHEHLAKTCMKLGRPEEALDWLEMFVKHKRLVTKNHNVITKSNLPYFYGRELRYSRKVYPRKDRLLPELSWKIFDPIRDTERFKALFADATEYENGN